VTFSPDGKTVVVDGDNGACLWDVATAEPLGWMRDGSPVSAACFSPDGKTLLTADVTNGTIRAWQVGTGKLLRQTKYSLPKSHAEHAFFAADGRTLGVVASAGEVEVWDVATGTRKLRTGPKGYWPGLAAALSPDGRTLVVGGERNLASLIDTATGKEIGAIEGPRKADDLRPGFTRVAAEAIYRFTFSPDGRLLAAVAGDSWCVWEVATGKRLLCIQEGDVGANGGGFGPALSPDGKYLACGNDEAIRLFATAGGREVRRLERSAGYGWAPAFSPDGKTLASVREPAVSLWDVATGKRRHPFAGHESPVSSLAFSPDGARLASADSSWVSADSEVLVWDVATGKRRHATSFGGLWPVGLGPLGVRSVAYSPDGRTLAGGGADGKVRLWDVAGWQTTREFLAHLGVQGLAFSPDGRTLASAGDDARARLWDVASGKRLLQVRGADSRLKGVCFAPDGKAILVAGTSGELALWRTDTGARLRDLGEAGNERRQVQFAAFLPDGRTVLSRESSEGPSPVHEVRFWDAGSGRLLRSFPMNMPSPLWGRCALSPDGKILAASSGDSNDPSAYLWDTDSGKRVGRVRGHSGYGVTALAFSPDGRLLATGGWDTTVLLWDVRRARLEHAWSELAATGDEGARAARRLAANPEEAVPFLTDHLRRAAGLEVRAAALIVRLDDDDFRVREEASRKLEDLGPQAAFVLRAALQESASAEVRRRLEAILDRMQRPGERDPDADARSIRQSLAVLEEIGTPAARQALEELARGPAASRVTREARDCLERLAKGRKTR
jgi:WD40 repeat protein